MPVFPSPLSLRDLKTIATSRLHSARKDRYQGEDERVVMDVFAPEDQVLLIQIYQSLLGLFALLKPCHDNHTGCRDVLDSYVKTSGYLSLLEQVFELGRATASRRPGEKTGRLVHDLRGGAFQALSLRLQLFALAPEEAAGLESIYYLVRDHLKIMRNCVEDLDPEQFRLDSIEKAHDAQLLVEKWSQAEFHALRTPVHIDLQCFYGGTLCESCLEFSSLDRIIYNLMNNAARATSDGLIHFYVFPLPDGKAPHDVRFVFANRVSPKQRQILTSQFGDDLGEIFRGGFTTAGHGLGSRICADFCAHAYGIPDFDQAKKGGYFGARWMDDYFVSWFHWPAVER